MQINPYQQQTPQPPTFPPPGPSHRQAGPGAHHGDQYHGQPHPPVEQRAPVPVTSLNQPCSDMIDNLFQFDPIVSSNLPEASVRAPPGPAYHTAADHGAQQQQ